MFRQTLSKATSVAKAAATTQQSRAYSKGTILGRLGAAPTPHQSANGKEFFMYNLAVNRPPKKDANGELVRDENGYPVRDTDWFTVFNFRDNAKASMERLAPGDLVLVDFNLTTRKSAENETDTMIHETSHRLVTPGARQE